MAEALGQETAESAGRAKELLGTYVDQEKSSFS
jgi:pyruvate dehydrogenase (quinone)